MKKTNEIFSVIYNIAQSALFVFAIIFITTAPVFAANDGCDDLDKNDRINPQITLCSAATYNLGDSYNPEDVARRAEMNEVVALKTTIMTQQMKKQYDYLETTIKRFKIQLEKAILTAKLEAAGGSSVNSPDRSGRNSKTGDKNSAMAGTENCNNKSTTKDVYACLRQNYIVIYNISNGGQTISADVRQQLAKDYTISFNNIPSTTLLIYQSGTEDDKICKNFQSISGRTSMEKCLNALNTNIRKATDDIAKSERNVKQ